MENETPSSQDGCALATLSAPARDRGCGQLLLYANKLQEVLATNLCLIQDRAVKSVVVAFSLAVLFFALPPLAAAPLKIVAAENFYGGVARQIVGDSASVTSILTNPNQDPHEFTSSAQTARAVADADVVIYSGIGYDEWMSKLLGSPGKTGRVVIDVADLIGAKDGDNPHIWYDPRTMPALGVKLVDILSRANPPGAASYRNALDAFRASMQPELDQIAELKKRTQDMEVTATEPVFGYMAAALGFKMLNYDFQVNVMNDTEPSAAQTAAFEQTLSSHEAKLLFYNSQVTDPSTDRLRQLATKAGVPIVGVTETEPPDQPDYAGWMRHELAAIEAALPPKKD
jgi:zinc/manganese transport system substrate-binding protein